jgi:hypothetical protein
MNEEKDTCPYFHRQCPSGCAKADCRSHFGKETKVIMESQKSVCQSLEYLECQRFIDGNIYREEKRLSRVGCPFLSDKICGKPGVVYCKGHVPPFEIKEDNNRLSCYGTDFADCPNYIMGIKFQESARKAKLNNAVVP